MAERVMVGTIDTLRVALPLAMAVKRCACQEGGIHARKSLSMSKRQRQKHKEGHVSLPAREMNEERARIEALLVSGKTRDAVEAAKQLLKRAPSEEVEALVVKAYQARMQALVASGMHKEAQALGALVNERFPGHKAAIVPLMQQSEVVAGNFEALLAELLHASPERRREIDAILTQGLVDPAILVNSPVLPADHPLKRMARVVSDLFTAVTTGPLPEGALAPLAEVARHSPLAPWKLLIRALDAFYRRAAAAVLANLAGIPTDSGPGRLVPVVRQLVGESKGTADRSFAVTTLIDKVSGNQAEARSQLTHLSQALAARDERKALAATQALVPRFQSAPAALRRAFLATLLHHWQRRTLRPEGLLRILPGSRKDPDLLRLIALALEQGEWEAALEWWDGYVTAATATGVLPAKGLEIARVLLHMANLFPTDPEEVMEACDVESEQQLRKLIRGGELPSYFDRGALLARARAADPSPLILRAVVEHHDRWGDTKSAEAEAEAWRRAYAQDLEPVLFLIRAAERRGAFRKALDLLDQAEALNRVHPDVRQARFRLLLASAERRLKEGKTALALEDLEQLAHEPRVNDGDGKAYLLALCWAAAHKAGDAAGVTRLEQTLAATVENPVLCDLIVTTVAESLKILPSRQPTPLKHVTQAQAIDGLARACDLFRMLERPLTVSPTLLTQVQKDLNDASPTQLYSLCLGGQVLGRSALAYAAAGQGLAQGGPLMYRFVLARGQALCMCWGPAEQDRARGCFRVARELATRARDTEAMREASMALDALPNWGMFDALLSGAPAPLGEAAPTQEEIHHVIDLERGMRKTPQFPLLKAPRKPRKTKPSRRRLPRGLFDEMLSFLDFGGKW